MLCFAGYFLPGFKGGGPVRSLANMFDWLQDDYEFRVLTRNRDLGDSGPYEEIDCGTWYERGAARVCYLDSRIWNARAVLHAVAETKPAVIYFQSFFDPVLTILPLVLRKFGAITTELPVIVAPRGEFSPGAVALKRLKKAAYFKASGVLGLYDGVFWHATNAEEENEIRDRFGSNVAVSRVPNLPQKLSTKVPAKASKGPGQLRLVWLSRIVPIKNLLGAIEVLATVQSKVSIDIYGPQEDLGYWEQCKVALERLPENISATYRGALSPDSTIQTLAQYDALLFLTHGENFGHVILEALLAACPLIISDQTPWKSLAERKIGFDLPLGDKRAIRDAIEEFVAMAPHEFELWANSARRAGESYRSDTEVVSAARSMLDTAISGR